jgi:uncharacterized protein YkwD
VLVAFPENLFQFKKTMKNYIFASSKFVLRAVFAALAICLLLNQNAFSENSRVDANINAFTNFVAGSDDDENEIFDLVNDERRRKRLTNLDWNDDLARVARKYSQQMAKGNFFSHFDKNGNGVEERVDAAGIKWRMIGENLYFCQGIEDYNSAAVAGWLKSPSHRANMLNKNWTETGIGIAESRDGKIYVTQVFLKR